MRIDRRPLHRNAWRDCPKSLSVASGAWVLVVQRGKCGTSLAHFVNPKAIGLRLSRVSDSFSRHLSK